MVWCGGAWCGDVVWYGAAWCSEVGLGLLRHAA